MNDEDLIQYCRQFINCDACGAKAPEKRCSRCHMVFYCDRKCQAGHWAQHKPDCRSVESIRTDIAGIGKGSAPTVQADADVTRQVLSKNPTCGVCLEECKQNIEPIVLAGCKHAFCFDCLKHWSDFQTCVANFETRSPPSERQDHATCPICRKDIPNLSQSLIDSALIHLAAANLKHTPTSERERRCTEARDDIEKLLATEVSAKVQVQAETMLLEVHILLQDYENALELVEKLSNRLGSAVKRYDEVNRLMEEARVLGLDDATVEESNALLEKVQDIVSKSSYTSPSTHAAVCLKKAFIQRKQGDWEGSKKTYQDTMGMYPEQSMLTPQQHREIFTGMSQCAYELGRYDIAIDLGGAAIEINPYFPWSHKYVALAYKASGVAEKAQEAAAQAVVYEAPWDEEHRSEVREFYREHFA